MIYKASNVSTTLRQSMRADYEGKTSGNSLSLKEISEQYDVAPIVVGKIAHSEGWEIRKRGYRIRNHNMVFGPTSTITNWVDGLQGSVTPAKSSSKKTKKTKPKSNIVTLASNNIQAKVLPAGLSDALVITLYRSGQLFQAA